MPLCRSCHEAYDARELDILHVLTIDEQLNALEAAGGLESARMRLAPSLYPKGVA